MKKLILSAALSAAFAAPAMAGGLLTNSNQNAAFLRNFAQEGQIDITSLYANPAGNAFLSKGWHISLNSQTAFQQRNIETTFPYFAYNVNDPNAKHNFKGTATAPVIPSFSVSYNWDRWSVNAHFGLIGGGGKCEFDKGLGSFEALYSSQLVPGIADMVNSQIAPMMPQVQAGLQANVAGQLQQMGLDPATAAAIAATGTYTATPNSKTTSYGLNAYMKGRSYYFGLQLGASYKITDKLSAYMGVRGVYANCNYNGYVKDIKASYTAAAHYTIDVPAIGQFEGIHREDDQVLQNGSQDVEGQDLELDCDQTGFGFAPIFGLDWKINDKWNVAVKYEASARLSLKNSTKMNDFAQAQAEDPTSALNAYQDGKKVRSDIPAILAIGAEYSPIKTVRLDASFKTYFEKSAADRDKMDQLGNTLEGCLGVEWDLHKFVTLSCSWQTTNYNMDDEYMNDLSFNLSSNSIGVGLRVRPAKMVNIDLGYMHTFYNSRNVPSLGGLKNDLYSRKNDVFGIGVNLNF